MEDPRARARGPLRAPKNPLTLHLWPRGWIFPADGKGRAGREELVLTSCDLKFSLGIILKLPIWGQAADENCFDDAIYWEVSSCPPAPALDKDGYVLPSPTLHTSAGWGPGSPKLRVGDRA